MGIIAKQTIRGSALTYAGIGIGFLTAGILLPKFLSKEEIGVLNLLLRSALLFSFFANLGFNTITLKLFPFYRNPKNSHNNFFSLKILVNLIGFSLFCTIYYLFEPYVTERYAQQSKLLVDFLYLVVPFVAIYMVFNALDTYNRVLYNAVQGTFLRDFLQRLIILAIIGTLIAGYLNFSGFMYAYVFAMIVPILGLLFYLGKRKELSISFRSISLTKAQKKEMISVGAFSLFSGIAPILVSSVDLFMVNDYLGGDKTGVYATMIFFTTVIVAPSKALARISATFVADAWKENDLVKIDDIHKRSSINQLLFSGLIFLGIWANMDNLFVVIPEFAEGKFIVFYLGLASLANMAVGLNNIILSTSHYYKYQTIFVIVLSFILIISNVLLIPKLGIIGAAVATLVATLIVNIIKGIFVYVKLKTQPFSIKTILLISIILVTYLAQDLLPRLHYLVDIVLRSAIISIIFIGSCYFLKVSDDFNRQIKKVTKKFIK